MFLKSYIISAPEQNQIKLNGWVIQINAQDTGTGTTADVVLLYRCSWKGSVQAEFNNLPEALDYCS